MALLFRIIVKGIVVSDAARYRVQVEEDSVPQPKKNEIRTVVMVVIALIMFLLIRRKSHFKYRHPSSVIEITDSRFT